MGPALIALGLISIAGAQEAPSIVKRQVIAAMEDTYRDLTFYSDLTTSVLTAESKSGAIVTNESQYRFVFHSEKGTLVDNFLGQLFLISGWNSVTNWFKAPARFSVSEFDATEDWRKQFFPVGSMMDSEHPVMAMLLDRKTGASDGHFPLALQVNQATIVRLDGTPAILIQGGFFFSSQGINWDHSDKTFVSGRLWIDSRTGFLRKAEYDITDSYSKSFGDVRSAKLTVTYENINVDEPTKEDLNQTFVFSPRRTDVKRDLSELFSAAPLEQLDDGTPQYLMNRPAPLFSGETLHGGNFSLAENRGKRLLLYFWASWCPNCSSEIGEIEQLASSGIENFAVIGVNVDSFVGRETIETYYERRGLSFASVMDPQNEITSSYRGVFIPSAFAIDSYGIIRGIQLGTAESPAKFYAELLDDID